MPETDALPIDYESGESTEILVPKSAKEAIAEVDIEESLYGKNKPRRVKIRREIIHDSGR